MRYQATRTGSVVDPEAAAEWVKANPDTEEDLIETLVNAAHDYCENFTGRAIAETTVKAYPERFETVLQLPKPPINLITSVKYIAENGQETTMDADDYDFDAESGEIRFNRIPKVNPELLPIEIEYVCGYAAGSNDSKDSTIPIVPAAIRQAMLFLIGHWYVNREAVQTGNTISVEVDLTTKALLRQYKVWWF